jgi:hypothetical protein
MKAAAKPVKAGHAAHPRATNSRELKAVIAPKPMLLKADAAPGTQTTLAGLRGAAAGARTQPQNALSRPARSGRRRRGPSGYSTRRQQSRHDTNILALPDQCSDERFHVANPL